MESEVSSRKRSRLEITGEPETVRPSEEVRSRDENENEQAKREEYDGDNRDHGTVRMRAAREVMTPSAREVKEHMITHVPFRSWCEHCVRGRAVNEAHPRE